MMRCGASAQVCDPVLRSATCGVLEGNSRVIEGTRGVLEGNSRDSRDARGVRAATVTEQLKSRALLQLKPHVVDAHNPALVHCAVYRQHGPHSRSENDYTQTHTGSRPRVAETPALLWCHRIGRPGQSEQVYGVYRRGACSLHSRALQTPACRPFARTHVRWCTQAYCESNQVTAGGQ